LIDLLCTHTGWNFDPNSSDWFMQSYHWLNVIEGVVWLVIAVAVVLRYVRWRNSPLELFYAFGFLTFGLSDFREDTICNRG
jgi:hypothetical protein